MRKSLHPTKTGQSASNATNPSPNTTRGVAQRLPLREHCPPQLLDSIAYAGAELNGI